MNYQRIWVIESKPKKGKGSWMVCGGKCFYTRKEGKEYLEQKKWADREWIEYRVSKYMGPITSGCIKEI